MALLARKLLLASGLFFVGAVLFAYLQMRPPRFALPERGAMTLRGVEIVQPGVARMSKRDVVIENGRIKSIAPSSGQTDGEHAGLFLLPGFIDMGARMMSIQDHASILSLRYGVTAVRDPGNFAEAIDDLRGAIEQGQVPGPRLFSCGLALDAPPGLIGRTVGVRTNEEGRVRVRDAKAKGQRCIAVFDRLSKSILSAVCDEAAKLGVEVVGRAPVGTDAGCMNELFDMTGVVRTATGGEPNLNRWMQEWAAIEVTSMTARVRSSSASVARMPRLAMWHALEARREFNAFKRRPELALSPSWMVEILWHPRSVSSFARLDDEGYAGLRSMLTRSSTIVSSWVERGVPVVVGSGAPDGVVHGLGLQHELRELLRAGLSAEQAIAAATTVPGERLKRAAGWIEADRSADLLLFERDPTERLENLDSLRFVIADGRLYRTHQLEAMARSSREHYEGWFVSAVWRRIAAQMVEAMNRPISTR